ncbi:SGNH/GDSL hydrolase family protein [uncultured Zobellia sp.]|uniref:SGNH/GDSL hydrolase family protein n=1 Tax=uncultured Zobellia sp. TaxID=255433 RepID=UPI002594321C|nr:SGNH/GDSL hydrolase family protein [uncultured Zobellia sp.]
MMKKLILHTFLFILLFIVVFECFQGLTSPIFSIRQFTADVKRVFTTPLSVSNTNDSISYNPNGDKILLNVNNIGFHSHIDFEPNELSKNYVLVGDSFVQSKICGTYNSIAYILDKKIDAKVFNFGIGGGNLNSYNDVYKTYNLKDAKLVFILITGTNDLVYKRQQKKIKESSLKIINLINQKLNGPQFYSQPNFKLFEPDLHNVVYLVHDNLTKNSLVKNGVSQPIIEIHIGDNYRFSDGHYTKEGNKLIANQIFKFLNQRN